MYSASHPGLIDTHCHLDFPQFDPDREAVIRRANENGVSYIINVGSSLESSRKSLELAKSYDFIYAAAGIHPHDADKFTSEDEAKIRELAKEERVVAIGEIGLDYYKNYSQHCNQQDLFKRLLRVALDFDLPIVVHSRQAKEETLDILKEKLPAKVVLHCFSGDMDFLKQCLDLGFFISFTCNITYKKAQNLRELIKEAPLERIFLETDAPYLSPEGSRGKRNEPLNVRFVAEQIAAITGKSIKEVEQVTTNSAKEFFSLEDSGKLPEY
ncbi:MAG: TatD family hydrolase [Candidatus Omnitrophica bacterium]|nr:TatD family hydrolase [Candidatus Omnitrophota bacterium]